MDRTKLLQNPLPIDRVAARVTRPAKPEDLWRPLPKRDSRHVPVGAVLPTVQIPWVALNGNPALADVIGKRRDRLTVLGYSAQQGESKSEPANWVVRCDCGNQEHRKRILRWLGTQAPDMCRECRARIYKTRGEWSPRKPAVRATAPKEPSP